MVKRGRKCMTGIIVIVILTVLVCIVANTWQKNSIVYTYQISDEFFGNPLMGYAPSAWHEEVSEDIELLYMDITWAELEPEEGMYNWKSIEAENQIERWRKEGKHLILRFVCDLPGEEKHMDVPQWLYDKMQGDGTWYDGEYGRGFAPNYKNEDMIQYHEKAVRALGEHFNQDGLITYIELGSLGHWGEWHVNYGEGIPRLPLEKIREEYVQVWTEAFPNAMILMRRPFATAEKYGFGLYNDMTGYQKATNEWLQWIRDGGLYEQTGEENGLVPMTEFWKTAPSGGEFTSSLDMKEMLEKNLDQTIAMIRDSHTTFLGPKIADKEYLTGYKEVLKNMGYRLWISRSELSGYKKNSLKLTWNNDGAAPFYEDWPVYIYIEDESGKIIEKKEIGLSLPDIIPGTQIETETMLKTEKLEKKLKEGWNISVGVEDPMTGRPQMRLAMKSAYENGKNRLFA